MFDDKIVICLTDADRKFIEPSTVIQHLVAQTCKHSTFSPTSLSYLQMHNIWVRLNAVLFFALTVLLFLATLCAFSTYLHRGKPSLSVLRINTLESLRNHGGVDRALLRFDLKADLSQAFHWNIKQLFVFVVAEYESKANPLNQVIIWDKIVKSPAEAVLNYPNEFVKYALIDQGAELRNKTVTLKLMFDHMPLTGRLYNGVEGESTFTLPGKYQTTSEVYNSGGSMKGSGGGNIGGNSNSNSKSSSSGSSSSSSKQKTDKKSGRRGKSPEL